MLQIERPQKPTIFSDLAIWWPVRLEALLFASQKWAVLTILATCKWTNLKINTPKYQQKALLVWGGGSGSVVNGLRRLCDNKLLVRVWWQWTRMAGRRRESWAMADGDGRW
jgi:hypothetical protein